MVNYLNQSNGMYNISKRSFIFYAKRRNECIPYLCCRYPINEGEVSITIVRQNVNTKVLQTESGAASASSFPKGIGFHFSVSRYMSNILVHHYYS